MSGAARAGRVAYPLVEGLVSEDLMKRAWFGATAGLALAFVFAGCGSQRAERTGEEQEAIQGGMDDGSAHPFAVGVCATNSGPGNCSFLCSGALIAPNLVLTARHCVTQTPQTIDCTTATFGAQNGGPSNYWITTYPYMFQGSQGWHQAAQIVTTPGGAGTKVCGNDMALLILKNNVATSEAPNVTPVVQYAMTDHPRYSTTVTAIGYGNTNTQSGAGTRRIRQNINLQCIPGDKLINCGMQTQIDQKEFASGDGTCPGDSGSSAYEQKLFNVGNWTSFGVLSRGGQNGTDCVGGIYTRTDSWKSLIVQTAQQAAQMGGYPAPSWTQPPPAVDGGVPGMGKIGDPCGDSSDCGNGLKCESPMQGSPSICTPACDPNYDNCPTGYQCQFTPNGGFCFPIPKPPDNPPADADSGATPPGDQPPGTQPQQSGGCALAADPTKPVPWKGGGVAAAALALLILRRRRA